MKIIGLTGGSGAGKSEIARLFAAKGAGTVDADAVYHRLLASDPHLLAALAEAFGDNILDAEPRVLNRAKLAKLVFEDAQKLARLNHITLPFIRAASLAEIGRLSDRPLVLYDAPTLYQAGADDLCDAVIGVLADRKVRRNRIMHRDGLTAQAAEARIAAQPADAFYREKCDFILENNGDLALAACEVNQIWQKLMEKER